MSRKSILTLAAAATVAVAMLSSQSADARGFGGFGGGFGGGRGFGGGAHFAGLRSFGGGHVFGRGSGTLIPIVQRPSRGGNPIIPIIPIHPIVPVHPIFPPIVLHHFHHHWVFRDGGWIFIDDDAVVDAPVVESVAPVSGPGPCTCLTKSYTPSGLVVFADVCTKESASAPLNATVGDATQVPTSPVAATTVPMSAVPTAPNYAGRTYDDYLAANPQLTNPQAANQQAPQRN